MKKPLLLVAFLFTMNANAQTQVQMHGCWKMASRTGEALQLKPDGNFLFDDYNALTKALERFYGTWKLSGKKITLMYNDRPQQNFLIRKDKKGQWMLKKEGGFLLVKAAPNECAIP